VLTWLIKGALFGNFYNSLI